MAADIQRGSGNTDTGQRYLPAGLETNNPFPSANSEEMSGNMIELVGREIHVVLYCFYPLLCTLSASG